MSLPSHLPMLSMAITAALCILGLCLLVCMYRIVRGPSLPDRVMALDTAYLYVLAFMVLWGIGQASAMFFEVALLIALLGFISTIAAARYMTRGNVIESGE